MAGTQCELSMHQRTRTSASSGAGFVFFGERLVMKWVISTVSSPVFKFDLGTDADAVVEGADHAVFKDEPTRSNDLLARFIEERVKGRVVQ